MNAGATSSARRRQHRAPRIDLRNWKGNPRNSGFRPRSAPGCPSCSTRPAWVDVYRHLHPEEGEAATPGGANCGQARAKNVGWRIDYRLASLALARHARRAAI